MPGSSSRQDNKTKGPKSETADFSSPQIWLPGHLSAWPDVKMPKSPTSKSKSDVKSTSASKSGANTAKISRSSQEQDHLHKLGCADEDTKKKFSLSLSDDEEDSTSATSSTDSQYQSADEDSFSKQRGGFNLTRKMDELSSGSDCELTDDEDSNKVNSSQYTPEEGASERKDVLKDATASQKRDKTTGGKKNQDKGGPKNVFNARSPDKEIFDTVDPNIGATSTQTQRRSQRENPPVTEFLETLSEDLLVSKDQSRDTSSSKLPAKLRTNLSANATPKSVPVRTRPFELSQSKQSNAQSTAKPQTTQENSAADTEAQRRASLLQKRGQREFSSNAFEVSDREDNGSDTCNRSGSKVKDKKEKKAVDLSYNPVVAEIARQQARLKEHSAKKMKENPERYHVKNDDKVYELTSDEEEGSQAGSSRAVGLEANGRTRDAAALSLSSRERSHDQSVTKKEKKKKRTEKKRKRDFDTDRAEEDDHRERKRRRSKDDDQDEDDERVCEKQFDQFLSDIQKIVAALSKAFNDRPLPAKITSLQTTINDYKAMKDVRANSDDSPDLLQYHKAKHDAEISAVLKSLWPILPKAILHATMRNLNKANRASLQQKLTLCLKGKQTNPNIRVVQRYDRHGDKVDLLEEYGVISEPDPHTMSSDLTLLTAAKSLIVLLSGERTGLDLSAIVEGSFKRDRDLLASGLKKRMQDPSSGISRLEEELRCIADERLKEVDQLQQENRILKKRLNKTK